MTREELDTLWFQAMRQSIEEGEDFIRYHFAALVAAHEREACAKVCEGMARPVGDEMMTFAQWIVSSCAAAIRSRGEVKP